MGIIEYLETNNEQKRCTLSDAILLWFPLFAVAMRWHSLMGMWWACMRNDFDGLINRWKLLEVVFGEIKDVCLSRFNMINERSKFCGLSEKSESERAGPADADAFDRLISLRLCIRFPYGLYGIGPFTLHWFTVGFGSFGGPLACSACRVKGVKIDR